MYDFSAIKSYIFFLQKNYNLQISLHSPAGASAATAEELRIFNIHQNSYCSFLKSNLPTCRHCVKKQKAVLEKSRSGAFFGTCYAGVNEFVYPIMGKSEVVGFISVGGYKSPEAESYISRISDKYSIPEEMLKKTYENLKSNIPDRKFIDTLIKPLSDMLELANIKKEDNPEEQNISFAEKIRQYIAENHKNSITSEDICRHFSCNRSYMSTEFNRLTGKTIRQYINELRIEDAKILLRHSELSVTDIAYSTGFTDSNYFSYIFKSFVGISPLTYRKNSN